MEDSIGKKRECVDFHDFHGSQLLEMISPKYQTDFTWALDRPKVVLYVTHSGKISSQSYWSLCGFVWKWGARPKWQCSWGHWSLTNGLWGAGCPIFDPCLTTNATGSPGWLVLCSRSLQSEGGPGGRPAVASSFYVWKMRWNVTFFNRIFLGVMGWFN